MADKSYAQANAVITALAANSLELALYSTMPDKSDAGGVEVSAGEYARQGVTLGSPSNGAAANTNTITFPEAVTTWTVAGWGLRVVGGTLRYLKARGSPLEITAGQVYQVAIGALVLSEVLP